MRIISQDGSIDVPYEGTVIVVTGTYIQAFTQATQTLCMGRYSTEEKVSKAMEMLREKYIKCNSTPRMEGYGVTTIAAYVRNAVFQFPSDDEVGA